MSSENSNSNNVGNGPSTVLSMPDDVEWLKAEIERLKPLEPENKRLRALVESLNGNVKTLKEQLELKDEMIENQKQRSYEAEAPCSSDYDSYEDEDEDEDDIVPQTRARQTILSAKIVPEFALLFNNAAVEDSLFDEANIDIKTVTELIIDNPLRSYLLSMDYNAYDLIKTYMVGNMEETEKRIAESVKARDDLVNLHLRHANVARLGLAKDVDSQKNHLEDLEKRLEESKKELAHSNYRYSLLEDQKEERVAEIQAMEKGMQVARVLLGTMEQLWNSHKFSDESRATLPLGSVTSANDKEFIEYKKKFNLTDYGSTKRSLKGLIAINRATVLLGLQHSPYWKNNNFPELRKSIPDLRRNKGKDQDKQLALDLRYHICKVFQIAIPRADENGKSPRRKRKSSMTSAPATKKRKNFGGEPTTEQVNAMLNDPNVRKMVSESPQIKRAFASAFASSTKKK